MQGSRHERAALVTTAYIIGGLTAFIAFGIQTTLVYSPSMMSATVVAALPVQLSENTTSEVVASGSAVKYVSGMLEVETLAGLQVLSFDPNVTGFEVGPGFETQGFHFGEPIWVVSAGGQFVYFCERHDPATSECASFIYDALRQTINPVSFASSRGTITIELARQARFEGDELVIGNLRSSNAISPWVLSYR